MKKKSKRSLTPKPEQMVWTPNPGKQTYALSRTEDEILYGGRRGGGKSAAGIAWLQYDREHPGYRALTIRETAKDLVDWVDRAGQVYGKLDWVAGGSPTEFKHKCGAIIRTGHLNDSKAYRQYQGHEYQKMLIEELTQIPDENSYEMLLGSNRSTVPEISPQVFATCNPDGPGFEWVKKRWNIEGTPTEPIKTEWTDPLTGVVRRRIFIPAGLEDNPYLDKDLRYRASLNAISDPALKAAWLWGSWETPIIAGAYYQKEMTEAKRSGRIGLHPFDPRLKVHVVFDLGYDDSTSVGFFQRTADIVKCIDYYEASEQGFDHYIAVLQEKREKLGYIYGHYFAPHDAKKHELQTGKTLIQWVYDTYKIRLEPVPMAHVNTGIQSVRLLLYRLYFNEATTQRVCSCLRNYRKEWDSKLLKFDDSPVHDWTSHGADMIRYAAFVVEKMTNEDMGQSAPQFKQYTGPDHGVQHKTRKRAY